MPVGSGHTKGSAGFPAQDPERSLLLVQPQRNVGSWTHCNNDRNRGLVSWRRTVGASPILNHLWVPPPHLRRAPRGPGRGGRGSGWESRGDPERGRILRAPKARLRLPRPPTSLPLQNQVRAKPVPAADRSLRVLLRGKESVQEGSKHLPSRHSASPSSPIARSPGPRGHRVERT